MTTEPDKPLPGADGEKLEPTNLRPPSAITCPECGVPVFVRHHRAIVAHYNRRGLQCSRNESPLTPCCEAGYFGVRHECRKQPAVSLNPDLVFDTDAGEADGEKQQISTVTANQLLKDFDDLIQKWNGGSITQSEYLSLLRMISTVRALAREALDGREELEQLRLADRQHTEAYGSRLRRISELTQELDGLSEDCGWKAKRIAELEQLLQTASYPGHYISTACQGGQHDQCRRTSKFRGDECQCGCGHEGIEAKPTYAELEQQLEHAIKPVESGNDEMIDTILGSWRMAQMQPDFVSQCVLAQALWNSRERVFDLNRLLTRAERQLEVATDINKRFNSAFSNWACGSEFHNDPDRIATRISQLVDGRVALVRKHREIEPILRRDGHFSTAQVEAVERAMDAARQEKHDA